MLIVAEWISRQIHVVTLSHLLPVPLSLTLPNSPYGGIGETETKENADRRADGIDDKSNKQGLSTQKKYKRGLSLMKVKGRPLHIVKAKSRPNIRMRECQLLLFTVYPPPPQQASNSIGDFALMIPIRERERERERA